VAPRNDGYFSLTRTLVAVADGRFALGTGFRRCDGDGTGGG